MLLGVFSRQLAVLTFLGRSEQDRGGRGSGGKEKRRGREEGWLRLLSESCGFCWEQHGVGEPMGCSWGTRPVSQGPRGAGVWFSGLPTPRVAGVPVEPYRSPVTWAPCPPCAPLVLGTGLGFLDATASG